LVVLLRKIFRGGKWDGNRVEEKKKKKEKTSHAKGGPSASKTIIKKKKKNACCRGDQKEGIFAARKSSNKGEAEGRKGVGRKRNR